VASTRLPFYGEPLKGLQVMGVLETRALDFKNIIMLSVNEGMIPKARTRTPSSPMRCVMSIGLHR
jgi:inactivated superfamily I helicase